MIRIFKIEEIGEYKQNKQLINKRRTKNSPHPSNPPSTRSKQEERKKTFRRDKLAPLIVLDELQMFPLLTIIITEIPFIKAETNKMV